MLGVIYPIERLQHDFKEELEITSTQIFNAGVELDAKLCWTIAQQTWTQKTDMNFECPGFAIFITANADKIGIRKENNRSEEYRKFWLLSWG